MRETGPAHDRLFEVEVCLAGESLGRGEGKTKKQASQEAARRALLALQESNDSEHKARKVVTRYKA